MKKYIKYLLFIIGLFTINYMVCSANTIAEGKYLSDIYLKRVPLEGKYYFSQARFIYNKDNGKILYCLEPFNSLINNSNYVLYEDNYANLLGIDDYTWKKIEAYAYFGYLYLNHEDEIWYAITQLLIWRAIETNADIYFTDKLNGNKINKYDDLILELETIVNNYLQKPDFSSDITLNLNESITFNLNGYTIDSNDILKVTDGNLTIDGNKKIDTTYQLIKGGNGINELYLSPNSQTVFASFGLSPTYFDLHVKVTAGNIIVNFKKEDGPYSSCSNSKTNVYGLYDVNNNLLDKIEVDLVDSYQSKDLPYGKYYIKQISSSCDVKKTNKIYEVEINKDNELPFVAVDIEKIKSNINIHKVFGYNDNFHDESDAEFIITDGINTFELVTNEKGLANIVLGAGEYTIKQISGRKNYDLVGEINILVNQSTDILTFDLVDEIKRANLDVEIKDDSGNLLSNIDVSLYDKDNNLIKTLKSNQDGFLSFKDLILGEYFLVPSIIDGYNKIETQNVSLTKDIKILLEYEKIIEIEEDNVNDENSEEIFIPDTFSTVSVFWSTLASLIIFIGILIDYED